MEYTVETSITNIPLLRIFVSKDNLHKYINFKALIKESRDREEDIIIYGDSGEKILIIGKGYNLGGKE